MISEQNHAICSKSGMNPKRKRVLLISNAVMHYRVSVYNYIHKRFAENGWEWSVLTNEVQSKNEINPEFEMEVIPFSFGVYRKRIQEIKPDAVILFLHLKDRIIWSLLHWLKFKGIPVASWTKTKNLDDPNNKVKNAMFRYVNSCCDGLILYAPELRENLTPRQLRKSFVANNTINHNDFPAITETPEEIKKSLKIPFKKVLLFVGRMNVDSGRKRVDHLIEIFRELEGNELGLVIVGAGMKFQLKERINSENTIYLGEVHDPENRQIARIFTMADVSAIPGHVGLGLNQAFFYGLPVVTMEGRQPPEIRNLKSGRNGYIVPGGDVAQLKDRIVKLMVNDELRMKFSKAAREDIHKEASVEGMFQGFYDCVQYIEKPRK